MATAGGVGAKLMRPSIQRICWLNGIGRRAPHTAHVAYGSTEVPASFVHLVLELINQELLITDCAFYKIAD